MKAIVYTEYGLPDVLRLEEIDKPTPAESQVLVRVRAASVNPADWHSMRGQPAFLRFMIGGLRRPKNTRPGTDLAGVVEAVGKDVTQFGPGEEVFGASRGAFAEYVCTQGKALAPKPANTSFEQAAAVPVAAFTALQGLRDKAGLKAGQKVLINGASGGVGTFAVQIARAFGAEVTAVCSTRNLDLVRSLGADRAIDYTREDFTRLRGQYDVLFDCIGNHPLSACRRTLTPTGAYIMVGGPLRRLLAVVLLSRFATQRLAFFIALSNRADLLTMKELIESGKVTPAIDRTYPLSQAAQAMRYLGEGHARGKVIITMEQP